MERWRQIEGILQEALQRDRANRDAFLRQACHGDTELQREVSSLLANHDASGNTGPWAAAAAAQLIEAPGSLRPGLKFGHAFLSRSGR